VELSDPVLLGGDLVNPVLSITSTVPSNVDPNAPPTASWTHGGTADRARAGGCIPFPAPGASLEDLSQPERFPTLSPSESGAYSSYAHLTLCIFSDVGTRFEFPLPIHFAQPL